MSEYTPTYYAVRYRATDGSISTVTCGSNKGQAELFTTLLNLAGISAGTVTRSATFPDWPKARFEYDEKPVDEERPPNAWSPTIVPDKPDKDEGKKYGGSIFDF